MRTLQADYKQITGPKDQELCVMATGGGAFKYYDRIKEALGIEVQREDEMECLIIGTKCAGQQYYTRANACSRPRLLHHRDPE